MLKVQEGSQETDISTFREEKEQGNRRACVCVHTCMCSVCIESVYGWVWVGVYVCVCVHLYACVYMYVGMCVYV